MNNNSITCDPQRIDLFLQHKLSDEEQTAFESHLDDCRDCREQLEAATAGDEIWSGVRDSLRGEQLPSDNLRCDDSALDSAAGGDASFSHTTVLKLLAPTDDERMLGRLGTYEIVGVVGSGGMGVVLKAFDPALNRYVAIKVLAPHPGCGGAARKRFSREAQAAAAVVHDNVMEIHGVADVEGLPYLVMPYVRGPSLQRRLDDEGPLALVEVLRISVQTATGLAAAHAQGLVHRDVKPANILLADGVERVKLTDFGLARAADDASLTKTGIIAGTPQYMSPEQARGESVGQRSDLFSLGSVMYAMCTGRAPFRAETSYGVLRRVTDDEPMPIREINPEIPPWLCQIIARLMSKQPDDRFASASEVAKLLEVCLAHVQQPMSVPLPASLVLQSTGSRILSISPRWLGVAAMVVAIGLGLLGMALWQATEAPDIAGKWTGPDWGEVVLEQKQPGEYEGTYTDTFQGKPGTMQLKWSRVERRFNGTWSEGKGRYGKISLRRVGDEVRGAWTTSKESQINSGTPRLADLAWSRLPADGKPKTSLDPPTSFEPFECQLVDGTTGNPIPGNDFAIDVRFVIPRQEGRPWQLVDEVFWGPNHSGAFKFTVPDKVLRHPDRDLIIVNWTIVHPSLDPYADGATIRVNEILNNDPRSARGAIRRIKLHSANLYKNERPRQFDEFTAKVFVLQHIDVRQIGRDELIASYERLLKQFPDHPERALAMFQIACAWQSTGPGKENEPNTAKQIEWLERACSAAQQGTPLWFEASFYLANTFQHNSPKEARKILEEILTTDPGPVNEVKAWYYLQALALARKDEEGAERICRKLHGQMSRKDKQPAEMSELGRYFEWIQGSASAMANFWAHQSDVPLADRKAKLTSLRNDFPFRHLDRLYEEMVGPGGWGR